MATSYPGGLDSPTNPTSGDNLNTAGVVHATQHTDTNDAYKAIEAELGLLPKGAFATVRARLDALDSGTFLTVRNATGSTLTKGSWVYVSSGTTSQIRVALARSDVEATCPSIGMVYANIANNTDGQVIVGGVVTGLATDAFSDGDRVFLSDTTAGGLTATAPSSGFKQRVGFILNSHPSNGTILVAPVGLSPRQDSDGFLQLQVSGTGLPTAPTDGVTMFSRQIAGKRVPAYVGPSGLDSALQPMLGRNRVVTYTAYAGLTTLTGMGMSVGATGTATAKQSASTNLHTQTAGVDFLAITAATTAVAGFRTALTAASMPYWRGNAAGLGGFSVIIRFSPATGGTVGTRRMFVGMSNLATAPSDVEPSSLTNMFGVGYDAADANWQIMSNDNTGTATKTNLGVARPSTDRPDVYEIAIFAPPNGSSINYEFTTSAGAPGAVKYTGTISTDLIPAATFCAPRGYHSVGGTSSVVGFTLFNIYVETDI